MSEPLTRRELRAREERERALAAGVGARRKPPVPPAAKAAMASAARRVSAKRGAPRILPALAMLFSAALFVGLSVPATAFNQGPVAVAASTESSADAAEVVPVQSLTVSTEAVGATPVRDGYSVTSYAQLLRQKYGNRSYSFSATFGAVRWPFPYPVPISDGWGERVSPCRGCSTYHQGVDFLPGEGSPIYAIADGVVVDADVSTWGYGNYVTIEHQINGQTVQSLYAHMQMNSSPLTVGSVVKVGDFVGLCGDTGASTGPHLHFELHLDGVPVDPFAWLTENAV